VIDAEKAVRAWVNANLALTGVDAPLPKGAHLRALRSPFKGAYVILVSVGGDGDADVVAELVYQRARISAEVRGVKKEQAAEAAIAYANAIMAVRKPTQMGTAVCEFVDARTLLGPVDLFTVDNEPRYVVDADFYFRP